MITTLLRRSAENPNTALTWDSLADVMSRESLSGVRVNRDTALTYSAYWRGVNLISRDVSKIPLLTYRRAGDGKERDTRHPAYKLLRRRANSEIKAKTLKEVLTAHALSHGNGYAWIERNGDGVPLALWPLDPEKTYPVRENGQLLYVLEFDTATVRGMRRVLPEKILHIKGLGCDGLTGYSVVRYANESIGLGLAARKFGTVYFRNAARPSVVIEVPGALKEEAYRHLKDSWESIHSGLENQHKVAILEQGSTIHPFSMNAKESQLLEMRQYELIEIANWFCLPPHKVGHPQRTSYNSLEQENQSYLDESLDYWLCTWEEECFDKLLTEREKSDESHVIEFLRQVILRVDLQSRVNAYNTMMRGGWFSRDEARSRENLNEMPDGEGKKFYLPLDVKVIGDEEDDAVEDVQQTALNGAQIASLLSIAQAVAEGLMPPEAATGMIDAGFPMLTDAQIESIVGPLKDFKPPEPEPPVLPQQPTDPEEDGDDDGNPLMRDLVRGAVLHACNRIALDAAHAAKRSRNFIEAIERHPEKRSRRLLEILNAPLSVAGGDAEKSVDWLLSESKARLLDVAGRVRTPDELVAGVESCMADFKASAPDAVADMIQGE